MAETFKVLGQRNPAAATLEDCYTVPASTSAIISTIIVCNRSGTATAFRLAVAPSGEADNNKHYLAYDAPILANEVWSFTAGLTLSPTDKIRVYATLATLAFSVFGQERTA